jgi:hypothetical protein
MLIDNPEVLRQAIIKTGARPTHEGAEFILDGQLKQGLDEYSCQIHGITDPIWQGMKDKAFKWPY